MFKRKKFTSKEYKDASLVFFVISIFTLLGSVIAGLIEGFEKSAVLRSLLVIITSFILGIKYKKEGQKETS